MEITFAHTGIKRGVVNDSVYRGLADILATRPNIIFSFSETDASDPARNGKEALRQIVESTEKPSDFLLLMSDNPHIGMSMVVSASMFAINEVHGLNWTKISGPENPMGGSGKHQHHRLDTWLNVINPCLREFLGETIAVVAQHQTSYADLNWRDPLNIRARRQQSYEAMSLVDQYAQRGLFSVLLRDTNDFLPIDRNSELRHRELFNIKAPTDSLGDYYHFNNVETNTGGLNSVFSLIQPFMNSIADTLRINKNVDSICLPQSVLKDWNLRLHPMHYALGDSDHGALVLGVGIEVK